MRRCSPQGALEKGKGSWWSPSDGKGTLSVLGCTPVLASQSCLDRYSWELPHSQGPESGTHRAPPAPPRSKTHTPRCSSFCSLPTLEFNPFSTSPVGREDVGLLSWLWQLKGGDISCLKDSLKKEEEENQHCGLQQPSSFSSNPLGQGSSPLAASWNRLGSSEISKCSDHTQINYFRISKDGSRASVIF